MVQSILSQNRVARLLLGAVALFTCGGATVTEAFKKDEFQWWLSRLKVEAPCLLLTVAAVESHLRSEKAEVPALTAFSQRLAGDPEYGRKLLAAYSQDRGFLQELEKAARGLQKRGVYLRKTGFESAQKELGRLAAKAKAAGVPAHLLAPYEQWLSQSSAQDASSHPTAEGVALMEKAKELLTSVLSKQAWAKLPGAAQKGYQAMVRQMEEVSTCASHLQQAREVLAQIPARLLSWLDQIKPLLDRDFALLRKVRASDTLYTQAWRAKHSSAAQDDSPRLLPKYPDALAFIVSQTLIEDGYGEYLLFNTKTQDKVASEEEFAEVYSILAQRHRGIKELRRLTQEKNKDLDLLFIPRTLYELMMMVSILAEELSGKHAIQGFPCDLLKQPEYARFYAQVQPYGDNDDQSVQARLEDCWHIAGFQLGHPRYADSEKNEYLCRKLVYRANKKIWEQYRTQIEALTGSTVAALVLELCKQIEAWQVKLPPAVGCGGLQIRKEDLLLFLNCLALECSVAAHKRQILYRAGRRVDGFYCPSFFHETIGGPAHSVSFGRGLLAGRVKDRGASVYHYYAGGEAKEQEADQEAAPQEGPRGVYALLLPDESCSPRSVFYLPEYQWAIVDMGMWGEFFHPRTRCCLTASKGAKKFVIQGVDLKFAKTPLLQVCWLLDTDLRPVELATELNSAFYQGQVCLYDRQIANEQLPSFLAALEAKRASHLAVADGQPSPAPALLQPEPALQVVCWREPQAEGHQPRPTDLGYLLHGLPRGGQVVPLLPFPVDHQFLSRRGASMLLRPYGHTITGFPPTQ